MSDQGPTVFGGRYELHRRLARGGMSDVVLARDQVLDRPVAVKVMFAQFAADPAFVERFRREAQAAANLGHPNIVGVFDWGQEGSTYYIVMEFIDGRSLAEILRAEGRLHPDRVADIGIDAASALSVAHREGIVHRDLKAGNLLISNDGQVKVADFGIATAVAEGVQDDLTQAGTVMGTASYFSPEQAQGKTVDPRSDIYSLGVVLYEAIAGRPPFVGESPVAIAYQHVQDEPPSFEELGVTAPPALEAIIMKCLAKDPAARYPTAEDLRADLRRYREGAQLVAPAAAAAAVPIVLPPDPTMAQPAATMAQAPINPASVPMAEPEYYDDTGRRVVYGVLGGIALLAVIVGGVLLAMNLLSSDDPPEEVPVLEAVPDVMNMTLADATRTLQQLGFEVDFVEEPNEDIAEGIVFAQDPPAGEDLEVGETVTLTVSSGAEPRPVANIVGKTLDQARAELEQQGFVVEVREIENTEEEAGTVLAQDPRAGTEARPGDTVILDVALGPDEIPIPLVEGFTPAAATQALNDAGFRVTEAEEPSETVAEGLVTRTDPPAGVAGNDGDTVTIYISTGIPVVQVPNLAQLTPEDASDQLAALGLNVTSGDLETTDPNLIGRVVDQDPLPFTELEAGETVTIFIGVEPPPTPTPVPPTPIPPTPVPPTPTGE